jgi:hypothetical protein
MQIIQFSIVHFFRHREKLGASNPAGRVIYANFLDNRQGTLGSSALGTPYNTDWSIISPHKSGVSDT